MMVEPDPQNESNTISSRLLEFWIARAHRLIGFIVGIVSGGGGGRYARHRDWGGFGGGGGWSGGSGGGWGGGSSGGGWSGGGGMSGGGGASGGW